MSLLVPIVLASFVLFQVFEVDVGKPKIAKKEEVARKIKISKKKVPKLQMKLL